MIDNRTPALDLPLPHPDNELPEDVVRLRAALLALDSVISAGASETHDALTAISEALQGKAAADDVASLQGGKLDKYLHSTAMASKTLAPRERCTVAAPGLTILLPPEPTAGDEAWISVGAFSDTTVDGGAALIRTPRGDDTSAVINSPHMTVGFFFDGSHWRVF